MTSYPNRGADKLSDKHRAMLYDGSGISPDVAAERGYYTARRRSEVPEAFAVYQRRLGLVVPMFSPDGEKSGYQLRPDKPRKGGPKYETPAKSEVLVDVHPRMLEEARSGTGDLWITEGAKKGDALTSRGLAALSLAGVWMWCVPKVKPYRLKPCFDHVRLRGRRVYVVFDSDALTKEGVQLALKALVEALEGRGAEVLVVYLEDAPDGSKIGVDDYLAAGHTVAELKMLARKFEVADVGNIRMNRDEKLRALVEDLERRWWAEEWKGRGGHSERDLALKLIEAATRSGKPHPDGIRVQVSWGVLQVAAKVARQTVAKALARLEERGFLYRDNEGRKREKAGAFVLRAKVDHQGHTLLTGHLVGPSLHTGLPSRALPNVPRLRWSRPKWKPTKKMIMEYRLRELAHLPEPRERIERLGKIRGAAVDALEASDGGLTKAEMGLILGKRPRDLTRRKKSGSKGRDGVLVMLEDVGIIETEGDVIRLAADWREKLNAARKTGGEVEADELAEDRRKLKSRAYRERDKALVSRPSAAGLAHMKRGIEKRAEHIAEHEEHQAKVRAADFEAKRFAKKFVHDRLRSLGRIRLGLLQEILRDEGGTVAYARPAAKSLGCTIEKLPEFGNEEFVFGPREWAA